MSNDNVVCIANPGPEDPLTELLRQGARSLIYEAVQCELTEYLGQHQSVDPATGKPYNPR